MGLSRTPDSTPTRQLRRWATRATTKKEIAFPDETKNKTIDESATRPAGWSDDAATTVSEKRAMGSATSLTWKSSAMGFCEWTALKGWTIVELVVHEACIRVKWERMASTARNAGLSFSVGSAPQPGLLLRRAEPSLATGQPIWRTAGGLEMHTRPGSVLGINRIFVPYGLLWLGEYRASDDDKRRK